MSNPNEAKSAGSYKLPTRDELRQTSKKKVVEGLNFVYKNLIKIMQANPDNFKWEVDIPTDLSLDNDQVDKFAKDIQKDNPTLKVSSFTSGQQQYHLEVCIRLSPDNDD
jgi:hypothetical protein